MISYLIFAQNIRGKLEKESGKRIDKTSSEDCYAG